MIKGIVTNLMFVENIKESRNFYYRLFDMKLYRGPLEVKEIGRTICQLEDPFGNIIGIEG